MLVNVFPPNDDNQAPNSSATSPSKHGNRNTRRRQASPSNIARATSPMDLLNPPTSPISLDGDDDDLALWAKKKSLQSDALRRHFTQMYDPRQLQEMNDELEMVWNCSICLATADDPCVTRCGHLFCRRHIKERLERNPSCPVCKTHCTPTLDIVPVFAREALSPLESPSLTPSSAGPLTRSTSPTLSPEYPHVSDDYFTLKQRQSRSYLRSPPPPEQSYSIARSAPNSAISFIAHYFGIVFRVVGLALLLGFLMPKTLFTRTSSGAGISHGSDL